MSHEIPANERLLWHGVQGDSRVFDRAQREKDLAPDWNGNSALHSLVFNDDSSYPATAALQARQITVVDQHEALLGILDLGCSWASCGLCLALRNSHGSKEQLDAAELVERKETGPRGGRGHREGRFKLILRCQRATVACQRVCDTGRSRLQPGEELIPHRDMQRPQDEIVGRVGPDL